MTLSQHTTQGDSVKLLKKIILWLFSKTITIHLTSRAVKGHRVQLLCANCWGPGVPSPFPHLILLSFSSPSAPISYFYLPHSLTLSFFCSSACSKKTPLQTVSCPGANISLCGHPWGSGTWSSQGAVPPSRRLPHSSKGLPGDTRVLSIASLESHQELLEKAVAALEGSQ